MSENEKREASGTRPPEVAPDPIQQAEVAADLPIEPRAISPVGWFVRGLTVLAILIAIVLVLQSIST